MSSTFRYPVTVVIGRWQLPHLAHKALIEHAFAAGERVMIVIGSSFRSRNDKNPFREFERRAMLESMLTQAQRARVEFVFVRDYYDDRRWADVLREEVRARAAGQRVGLVGFKKDASGYYLDLFPDWAYEDAGSIQPLDATRLRDVYFGEGSLSSSIQVLEPYVEPGVLDYLRSWAALPEYEVRRAEHQAIKRYKAKYTGPYFLTADSVLQVNDHVLLIKRGGEMGHGQWALPGGFVDPGEQFYDAAVRELNEETRFAALPGVMRAALKSSAVFDHPDRSPRGRLITQAFHFRFSRDELPQVQGADDAKEAVWWPIEGLSEIEADLFEDHAVILDHFFGFR